MVYLLLFYHGIPGLLQSGNGCVFKDSQKNSGNFVETGKSQEDSGNLSTMQMISLVPNR